MFLCSIGVFAKMCAVLPGGFGPGRGLRRARGRKIHFAERNSAPTWGQHPEYSCNAFDAPDGKIDLIITKSVSRFARNTVDSLTTVRKLKERGLAL